MLVRCGCLNIAKRSVTPNLTETYAQMSDETLTRLGLRTAAFDGAALRRRYPYLDADLGRLDVDAGVVDVPAATHALRWVLAERRVEIHEETEPTAIVREGAGIRVIADAGEWAARSLVVTAGHGTNDVLAMLPGCGLRVPITKDRPREAKYFTPPAAVRDRFTAGAMPAIAYLDTGIYCHPIVDGLVDAVKIGYYNPPDLPRAATPVDGIASVRRALHARAADGDRPRRRGRRPVPVRPRRRRRVRARRDPGRDDAFVGVGWRGTGYKFAPWVGRVLAELALQRGTVYDIGRFDPARFDMGGARDAVAADSAAAPL